MARITFIGNQTIDVGGTAAEVAATLNSASMLGNAVVLLGEVHVALYAIQTISD